MKVSVFQNEGLDRGFCDGLLNRSVSKTERIISDIHSHRIRQQINLKYKWITTVMRMTCLSEFLNKNRSTYIRGTATSWKQFSTYVCTFWIYQHLLPENYGENLQKMFVNQISFTLRTINEKLHSVWVEKAYLKYRAIWLK